MLINCLHKFMNTRIAPTTYVLRHYKQMLQIHNTFACITDSAISNTPRPLPLQAPQTQVDNDEEDGRRMVLQ